MADTGGVRKGHDGQNFENAFAFGRQQQDWKKALQIRQQKINRHRALQTNQAQEQNGKSCSAKWGVRRRRRRRRKKTLEHKRENHITSFTEWPLQKAPKKPGKHSLSAAAAAAVHLFHVRSPISEPKSSKHWGWALHCTAAKLAALKCHLPHYFIFFRFLSLSLSLSLSLLFICSSSSSSFRDSFSFSAVVFSSVRVCQLLTKRMTRLNNKPVRVCCCCCFCRRRSSKC